MAAEKAQMVVTERHQVEEVEEAEELSSAMIVRRVEPRPMQLRARSSLTGEGVEGAAVERQLRAKEVRLTAAEEEARQEQMILDEAGAAPVSLMELMEEEAEEQETRGVSALKLVFDQLVRRAASFLWEAVAPSHSSFSDQQGQVPARMVFPGSRERQQTAAGAQRQVV